MSSPIKDVLQALSRHAEVIESNLHGVVSVSDGVSTSAITALRQASALRAVGDDGYRVHPRLREYLEDHLQLFPAYQSLAEIGSKISQIHSLWSEIELVRLGSDYEAVDSLVGAFITSGYDIVDAMGRNLLLLYTHMSTRYGNVTSLELKKSQNRYYQKQSNQLALDLTRLGKVAGSVESEASARGMDAIAVFLRKQILTKMSAWQHSLSEIQTQIRKEIFRTREVEKELKLLSRMDIVLKQQPGWKGIDVALDGEIDDFLLAARLPAFVANADVLDTERDMVEEMTSIAKALPTKKSLAEPQEKKVYKRVKSTKKPVEPTPGALALDKLVRHIEAAERSVSLMDWQKTDEHAQTMEPHIWLPFSILGLRGIGIRVALVKAEAAKGEKRQHLLEDGIASKRTQSVAMQ